MNADDPRLGSEDCGSNAAPYVLGALTGDEHEQFVGHLESCTVCREEVAALQVVASALSAAAPPVRAPATLKQKVMRAVREDARVRTAQGARLPATVGFARPWRAVMLGRLRWRPNLAVAALSAAVVALAVIALQSGSGGGSHAFPAKVLPHGASASLKVSGGHAQLNIVGMPQSTPGHIYEVWIKRSAKGAPLPTDALFTIATGGGATVGIPGGVGGVQEVLVTSEPLGGTRVPTLPVLIDARVS